MYCDTNKLLNDDSDILSYKCDVEDLFYHNINHSVLFEVPLNIHNLTPHQSLDKWDNDHVRMPFSSESKYVELTNDNKKDIKSRWNFIKTCLSKDIKTSYDLELTIKEYNSRYESVWKFDTLHEFVRQLNPAQSHNFFNKTIPKVVNLALRLPDLIKCPIPLLKQGMNRSISMSQVQAASILANCFLCTFPRRNSTKKDSEYANYPSINFNRLYNGQGQNVIEKLKCIVNYFERVTDSPPKGILTFTRRSIGHGQLPNWNQSPCTLKTFSSIKYTVTSKYKIEDASEMLQVDFSNKSIGGGVLGNGCVQEEIRFCMNPELIVARLFTENLTDQEALLMIGSEQFNQYTGYASNFRFTGNYIDQVRLDNHYRKRSRIIAMDALRYKNFQEQFSEANLVRELNKAFAGFFNEFADKQPVATGLWGCGAFGGHIIKSAVIQLMACALTQRNLLFFTFGDITLKSSIESLFECLIKNSVTVARLFSILRKFNCYGNDPEELVRYIRNQIRSSPSVNICEVKPQFNIKKPSTSNSIKSKALPLFNLVDETKPKIQPQESPKLLKFSDEKKEDKFAAMRNKFNAFGSKPATKKTEQTKPIRSSLLDALDDDFK